MKKIKVYVIHVHNIGDIDEDVKLNKISDEYFMDIAEKKGCVYTLKDFETAFNNIDISIDTDFIRFIEVEV